MSGYCSGYTDSVAGSCILQIGSFAVPKGTPVQIGVYAMHHDERWWQDAEQFKPERWLGDKTGGDRSGGLAYLPFGGGPRMCIGVKLAGTQSSASSACLAV